MRVNPVGEKMAALHFTTILCEPYTMGAICFCANDNLYAGFITFLYVSMSVKVSLR